jgi:hypothetical protein
MLWDIKAVLPLEYFILLWNKTLIQLETELP